MGPLQFCGCPALLPLTWRLTCPQWAASTAGAPCLSRAARVRQSSTWVRPLSTPASEPRICVLGAVRTAWTSLIPPAGARHRSPHARLELGSPAKKRMLPPACVCVCSPSLGCVFMREGSAVGLCRPRSLPQLGGRESVKGAWPPCLSHPAGLGGEVPAGS